MIDFRPMSANSKFPSILVVKRDSILGQLSIDGSLILPPILTWDMSLKEFKVATGGRVKDDRELSLKSCLYMGVFLAEIFQRQG